MPSRILRDWTDSFRFDGITADAERLFVRLIMKVDDYGRFPADVRLIKSQAYPLENQIRPNDLERWIEDLIHRKLILRYEVEGRAYLAILNFNQRLRQEFSKYPQKEGEDAKWKPTDKSLSDACPSNDGQLSDNGRLETKRRRNEEETETKDWAAVLPFQSDKFLTTWKNWIQHRNEIKKPMKPTQIQTLMAQAVELGEETFIQMIDQSIRNGWQGIFEVKKSSQKSDNRPHRKEESIEIPIL